MREETDLDKLNPPICTIENLANALHECRYGGGLAASGGKGGFGYARFTRDYLQAMSDLMTLLPSVVREGFSQIPQEQGVKYDPLTEEEPDRLPHQVAQGKPSGLVVPAGVVDGWHYYLEKWGVPYDEQYGFVVYNASDTGRYVTLLAEYVRRHGREVLNDQFIHRPTGQVRTVAEAGLRLTHWIVHTIERSDLGLLEVRTQNPRQTSWSAVMRDGIDSYFHPHGTTPEPINRTDPVAYIENQGIAVDALLAAAELWDEHPKRDHWLKLAGALPDRTLEQFWMPSRNYLAPAIDRDQHGHPRQVRLISSAPMELMATGFFEPLPQRHELIEAIVGRVFDPGFMTPVGVRMLALEHAASEQSYYAYQGTGAVWGVTQRVVAHGLRRQGLAPLAHELGLERFVAGLNRTGKLVEYWLVDRGRSAVNYHPYRPPSPGSEVMAAAERPAQPQLWTISGAIAELLSEEAHSQQPAGNWESKLTGQQLERLPSLPPTASNDPQDVPFVIDVVLGKRLRQERAARLVPHSVEK